MSESSSESDFLIAFVVIFFVAVFITFGSILYNFFDQKQEYQHEITMYQLKHPSCTKVDAE